MHALLRIVVEPYSAPGLAVDERDLLAAAQIVDGLCPPTRRDPVGNAAAIAPAIKAEYEPGLCRRAPMHERIDAKRTMRPDQACISPLKKIEPGPPHQRTVGEDPEVLVALIGACIHRDGRRPAAGVRVTGRRFPCNPQVAGAERPYSPGFEVR